jgi:MraZ protein
MATEATAALAGEDLSPGPLPPEGTTSPSLPFTGRYQHTLDAKGRIVLPAPFRGVFAAGGHLTLWQGPCVAILPPAEFRRWVETTRAQLEESGFEDPAGLLRQLHLRSATFRPDSQGRFLLPEDLRAAVGIERDITVVGNDARLELWRPGVESPDAAEHEQNIGFFQGTYDLLTRRP